MSAFDLVKKPIHEIREFLAEYSAELRETALPNTYLVKFSTETKVGNPAINHLKGLLFNAETGFIYSITYPVPTEMRELTEEEQQAIVVRLSGADTKYEVQEALDGTLLRLSYIGEDFPLQEGTIGKTLKGWLLSTNGKEDARHAFWMNGCSFFDQFWSASPSIQVEQLNQNYVYLFLLCHPLNVIVINHKSAKVYHVATYDRTNCHELDLNEPTAQIGVERLNNLEMTVEDVQTQIKDTISKPVNSAGYLVIDKTDPTVPPQRYRFENFNYTRARELRGDSNNIDYLMVSFLLSKDRAPLEEFLQYYPIYRIDSETIHQRLANLAGKFYREYGLRYKEHANIIVHPRHHRFLGELHTQLYLARLKGQGRTIQYADIMEYLKTLPPARILHLLNYIYDRGEPVLPMASLP